MNERWPQVRLGEVLRRRDPDVSVDATQAYQFAGVYSFGRGVFRSQQRTGGEFSYRVLTRLRAGDFIYPKLMAWEGAFGIVPVECDGCYVSPEFPVFAVDTSRLVPAFLGFYFRLPRVWAKISGGSIGTNVRRRRLNPAAFEAFEVSLPSLDEQQRIVAQIEELEAKIEETQRLGREITEECEALVTSLHLHLAGDRTRALTDVVELDEHLVAVEAFAEYPQVGVRSFGGGLFGKEATRGMDTTYRHFNRLYEGAIVLSQVKGWEGAVALCGSDLAGWFVSPEYRTFRCISSEADPEYFASIVRTTWFRDLLQQATRGVGARRERTRPEQFLLIELPMPTRCQQTAAARIFKRLVRAEELRADSAADLDTLLPSILDRAFKGEL